MTAAFFNFTFSASDQIFFQLCVDNQHFVGSAEWHTTVVPACIYNATKMLMFHFAHYNSGLHKRSSQKKFVSPVVQTLYSNRYSCQCKLQQMHQAIAWFISPMKNGFNNTSSTAKSNVTVFILISLTVFYLCANVKA
jgi:hypothetical protein